MSHPGVPLSGNDVSHRRQLAVAVNNLLQGKMNATGLITLEVNSTTTSLIDDRLALESGVFFDPLTENAKADIPLALEADRNNGQWVLTHADNDQTDRTFRYFLVG